MTVDKMSVSLATSLSSAVRDAAEQAGETLSGWLADAAQAKLRAQALEEFLAVWERENGPITEHELRDATSRLDLPASGVHRWTSFVKVTAWGGSHAELISTIAHLIEDGRSVLVLEQDVADLSKMVKAGGRVSLERAEVRMNFPTE
jgi:hypothetical protein